MQYVLSNKRLVKPVKPAERKRMMKRTLGILSGVTMLAVVTVVSSGQQPQPAPEGNIMIKRVFQGPEGAPPPPPPMGDFVFIASEVNFGGKIVKGVPFSAEAVTETVQTLGDGNRITNRITSSVYRDTEGRTRREQTLKGLGPLGTGGEPLQTIFINDPVAGVTYSLDSRSHIAHKSVPFEFKWAPGDPAMGPPPGAEGQKFEFKVERGSGAGGGVIMRAPMAAAALAPPEGGQFNITTESGGASYVFKRKAGPNANEVKEQLGKQLIEGVEADGTRTTVTIPAGEIGNERPIEIVSERWYSAELQMVVMTRHSDPRSGETIYKLTNISRTEPAKSLFEVPSDYTVKEGRPGVPMTAPMPRVKKPANPE
jgi:hypothetical protein